EERQLGAALQHVQLGGDVVGRADRDDDAANLQRIDPARRDLEGGIVERHVVSAEPRHHELRYLLPRRQLREHAVDSSGAKRLRGRRGTAAAGRDQRNDQESMRAHRLVWIVLGIRCSGGTRAPSPASAQVRPGIEVLLTDSARLIAGKRLGLLSNHTGVDRLGHRDVDVLRTTHDARLTVLFSPEHGFRGTEDRSGLPDSRDSATGLPIYSLYGGSRSAAAAALDSVDVLLVDLQDIGARYYTYIATVVQLMRTASRTGTHVIILDRPDPVGGALVQGNVRARMGDPDSAFSGFMPVAMRYGMTLGELARLANDVMALHANLVVVPAAGWHRTMLYDETGLPWVKPSPNMPDLESALHYAGTCLFEGANVSFG